MIQTSDPDPRSSFPRELIQTIDPDLWNDIMNLRVDAPVIYPVSSQATNCCNQAVKLPSSLVLKLRCSAVQQPSCNCCASKLPSWHWGCQAAKLSTCRLHTLSSFSCHTASKLQQAQKRGSTSGPIQTDPDPIHTTTSPDHNQLPVKTCDCLVSFLSSSCWFTIH